MICETCDKRDNCPFFLNELAEGRKIEKLTGFSKGKTYEYMCHGIGLPHIAIGRWTGNLKEWKNGTAILILNPIIKGKELTKCMISVPDNRIIREVKK